MLWSKLFNANYVGELYCRNHRKKASTALNICHICYRKRLINKKQFVLNPIYTFPKKYKLSTDIKSLSNQINQDWEIDFIPSIKLKHHFCHFVDAKNKLKHQDVHKYSIFANLLMYSNLRTGFVYFRLFPTRSYKDIRLSLESFLHTYGIQKLRLYCDRESAFLKAENLTGGNRERHIHNSLDRIKRGKVDEGNI